MQMRAACLAASIRPSSCMEPERSITKAMARPPLRTFMVGPSFGTAVTVRTASMRSAPTERFGLKKLSILNCMELSHCVRPEHRLYRPASRLAGPANLLSTGAQSLHQFALERLNALLGLFTPAAIVLADLSTLADGIEQTAS